MRRPQKKFLLHDIALTLVIAGMATGIGWLFRLLSFPEVNVVVLYILSVILTARFTSGYTFGVAAAVFATLSFNYFFTAPFFTLSVYDLSYLITFAVMTLTSLITSALTTKVKQAALEAQRREFDTAVLYRLTSNLTDAEDVGAIAQIAVAAVSEAMGCRAGCLCCGEDGRPEASFLQQRAPGDTVRRGTDAQALLERLATTSGPCEGEEFFDWPIRARETLLGVIRIPRETAEHITGEQERLLRSMIESISLAMDRLRIARERIRSREEMAQERYRGNLLRAISHDLRTPLSGIMGTSEMLMHMTDRDDPRYDMAQGIYREVEWLHALVENILNLTRLQDGRLVLNKQPEAVEEVIGAALSTIGKRAPDREITAEIPSDVLYVPMDIHLISQVLVNLLDNALKHTPQGEIKITVREDCVNHLAVFTVADRGSGISAADLPHIFQMFYTSKSRGPDAQRGVGLGLAICESIVTAHGGTITAGNRTDGSGAEFTFTLPLEDKDNAKQ
ncbi:sensor histidine kinase [Feifania hominis]|uniref:sensor histidine kinase n=1 Tax=Feifania hominis TaxID=2763660 RepID=UPI0020169980|nr:ATP-binding protein [Feifania hominis]